jgi:predicted MFS family arabinose efflux permease
VGAVRDVLAIRDARRLEVGWGCSVVGELAGAIALAVYAFEQGGAVLVGVYGLARTLPAAIVTPLVMGLSDRVSRERLLTWATAWRAAFLGGAAGVAATAGPAAVVIGLAAASSLLAGTFRPLMVAILPWLAHSPGELAAGNVLATVMENSAALTGPIAAAVLLGLAAPWAAIGMAAAFLAVSCLLVAGIGLPAQSLAPQRLAGGLVGDAVRGVADLARVAPPAGMVVLLFAQTLVRGTLTVLLVVLAVDVLGFGGSAVGWLYAAIGIGGLAGGAAVAGLVRADRLGRCFIVGLLLWGVPLALLAPSPGPVACFLALGVVGAGNAVQDVGGGTLTPRLFSPGVLGRVLGAEELIVFAGGGVGAAVAAPMIDGLGARGTLAASGIGLVALVAAYAIRFVQIDRDLPAVQPSADLMRGLPMFAPLPLAVVDLMATRLVQHECPSGAVIMHEGEPGDDFQVIVQGHATVTVRGSLRRTLGPGDGFGEIALLRNSPRTATVTTTEPVRTVALQRPDFLAAIRGNAASWARGEQLAEYRLASDPRGAQR